MRTTRRKRRLISQAQKANDNQYRSAIARAEGAEQLAKLQAEEITALRTEVVELKAAVGASAARKRKVTKPKEEGSKVNPTMPDQNNQQEETKEFTLVNGSPVTPDHREINLETGQQKGYVVLSEEERAKGFVRPVRKKYLHTKCGVVTRMSEAIAETYARNPSFYGATFCISCRQHLPLAEFIWDDGSGQKVGS